MRINEIETRLAEIATELQTADATAVPALVEESNALMEERSAIQQVEQTRQATLQRIANGAGTPMNDIIPSQPSAEQRAADAFRQSRSMTVDAEQSRALLISSGTLAQPTVTAGINDIPGAKYSSIIDLVKVVNCAGMGTHRVAYVDEDAAEAGNHTEGQAAGTTNMGAFKYVDIKPTDVAVLDYISKQAKKQTNLQYATKVREQAMIALRRKAVAIVTAALDASELNTEIAGKAIDATTLRTLALQYGGDESTIGGAHLVLNKKDLIKFGDVRGTNEKKALYEITPDSNGNTGTIKEGGLSVRYVLNSKVAEGTLFYGNLQSLELDLFSDYEIKISEDFAFDKLMDTIRGDVELGTDVIAKGAFIKYTTAAA